MSTMIEEPKNSVTPPAPLRPELAERFLAAMQAASVEVGGEELERRLRRLRPAPIEAGRLQAWTRDMEMASAGAYRYRGSNWRSRWGAVAALLVLCTSGVILMMNSSASASASSGLACRSVIDSQAAEVVQWQEGQVAVRSCDVLYEDSFVLDGEEDSTIMVRVPVRSRVLIEEEVI